MNSNDRDLSRMWSSVSEWEKKKKNKQTKARIERNKKVPRNKHCPCGSNIKYKKCCHDRYK